MGEWKMKTGDESNGKQQPKRISVITHTRKHTKLEQDGKKG